MGRPYLPFLGTYVLSGLITWILACDLRSLSSAVAVSVSAEQPSIDSSHFFAYYGRPIMSLPPSNSRHALAFSIHSTIFLFLLSFRILNAVSIRTFFQPDEYFQSLEPAWHIVFREGWLTWVIFDPSSLPSYLCDCISRWLMGRTTRRNGTTSSAPSRIQWSSRGCTSPSLSSPTFSTSTPTGKRNST
jgi:hypothetical protein